MDEYHFMADVMSTWRSQNDWIKAIIVVGFYVTVFLVTLIIALGRPWLRLRADRPKPKKELQNGTVDPTGCSYPKEPQKR